ncbi:N-acetylmuramoyl-L-alanine amidase [Virgibacillus ihumii]|uniref:N-acetylmuramoyl-L-alanine amidase n=1 Tax=Virgibacillus ihumii TaxID=2686091 RepID=UPI00157C2BEE|nr:N-acetylmuramoyl-L-alanine amidase [Virgibacillus ihumii]
MATADKSASVVVNTDNLNVRSSPGTQHEVVTQVHSGDVYPMIQQQDKWVQIRLQDQKGWLASQYVTIQSYSDGKQSKQTGKTITISKEKVHLRGGPASTFDIVGFAEQGAEFQIISETEKWYEISNDNLTGFILKDILKSQQAESNNSIKNKTIVIDAGHGGRDIGAIGANGTYEKHYTYQTMRELKHELTMLGADVIVTREKNEFVSLASRTSLSNLNQTDAFISIHYNSFPKLPSVTGISAYYYRNQYQDLARYILEEVSKETGVRNRGSKFADYQVIRQNLKPAILLELGFISNPEKEKLLQTNAYQKKIVTGIVNGLNRYFKNEP